MTSQDKQAELSQALRESARYLHQNRPGEALDKLLPFHNAGITDPDLAINIGGSYILQRKWDKAVKVLSQAAKVYDKNVMLWVNLAAAHLGRLETAGPRHQQRAIQAYERALQLDPKVPNVHYHLGLIYKERGELTRACAFFQQALEVNPADKDAAQWLEYLEKISLAVAKEKLIQEGKTQNDSTLTDDSESAGEGE